MKNAKQPSIVFFNASVILSGLRSPNGGSGELLRLVRRRKIAGVVSEIILDEVLRNAVKIGLNQRQVLSKCRLIFTRVLDAPAPEAVEFFRGIVVDFGDSHVLASAKESKAKYLVSLDKKHLLVLQRKIKWINIVSPGELIARLKLV